MNPFKNNGVIFLETVNNKEKDIEEELSDLKNKRSDLMNQKNQLEKEQNLSDQISDEIKQVNNKIKGLEGEKAVFEELKYCGTNMKVIYDLFFDFTYNNYQVTAQIDFFVFTSKNMYIFECKNWKGDIGIDKFHNFFWLYDNKPTKRIASPLAQIQKQSEVVKAYLLQNTKNFFDQWLIQKIFKKNCKKILLLVNTGERVYIEKCDDKIKNQIIYKDNLYEYIRNTEKGTKNGVLTWLKRKRLASLAEYYAKECQRCNKE